MSEGISFPGATIVAGAGNDPAPDGPPWRGEEAVLPEEEAVLSPGRAGLMVFVLTIVVIFSYADRKLPFILAESIKHDLGLSDVQLGLLNGAAFLTVYAVAAVPLGLLADRGSSRNLLAVLVAIWTVMTAAGGLAANFVQLVLTRMGVALGEAGGTPAEHALIQRGIPRNRRGRAFAYLQVGSSVGSAVGLGLGGWLNTVADWRTVLIASGVFGLAVVLLVMLFVPDLRSRDGHGADARRFGPMFRKLIASPAFLWLFLSMAMLGTVSAASYGFSGPLLIRCFGLDSGQAGLLLGVGWAISGSAGVLVGGAMFDSDQQAGRARVFLWSAIGYLVAGGMAACGYLSSSALAAVILVTPLSLAGNFPLPATYGTAHIISGPAGHAVASSLLLLGLSLVGGFLGPLIVGLTSDMFRPTMGVDSLRWGMMVIPVACLGAALSLLAGQRHLRAVLARHAASQSSAGPGSA